MAARSARSWNFSKYFGLFQWEKIIFCQNAYFCSPLNDFLFSAHRFRLTFKGSNPRRKFSEDLEVFFEEGLVVKNIELYTPENVLKSSLCDTINKN